MTMDTKQNVFCSLALSIVVFGCVISSSYANNIYANGFETSTRFSDLKLQLADRFAGKSLKALIIAPGSTGDVLPLLNFGASVNAQLNPWLQVTRIATFPVVKLDDKAADHGIEACPLMPDYITAHKWSTVWKDMVQSSMIQQIAKNLFTTDVFAAMESQIMNTNKLLEDADVIFWWSTNPACDIRVSVVKRRLQALGNRLVIQLSPTLMFDSTNFQLMRALMSARPVAALKNYLQEEKLNSGELSYIHDMLGEARHGSNLDSEDGAALKDLKNKYFSNKDQESSPFPTLYFNQYQKKSSVPQLALVSPALVSPFFDVKNEVLVGTSQEPIPDGYEPPAGIAKFLDLNSDKPKVYIGFGSTALGMSTKSNVLLCKMIDQLSDKFAFIWQIGRSDEKSLPGVHQSKQCLEKAFILREFVNHRWLFSQVDTVVHHGGAGTTQSGILAGAATVIIPQLPNDQLFFSAFIDLQKLGVGLERNPGVQDMIQAVEKATVDNEIRENVGKMKIQMQKEVEQNLGVTELVKIISDNQNQLLQGAQISRRPANSACLKYGNQFKIKSKSTGRYCQMIRKFGYFSVFGHRMICESGYEDATNFFFDAFAEIDNPSQVDVGIDGRSFLAFIEPKSGRKMYLAPTKRMSRWTRGFFKSSRLVKPIPIGISKGEYDHCVRNREMLSWTFPASGQVLSVLGDGRVTSGKHTDASESDISFQIETTQSSIV